jgi:hypothetical protein
MSVQLVYDNIYGIEEFVYKFKIDGTRWRLRRAFTKSKGWKIQHYCIYGRYSYQFEFCTRIDGLAKCVNCDMRVPREVLFWFDLLKIKGMKDD